MSSPKRHHWWPQLNSEYWRNAGGDIHVLNRDGTSFWGRPNGLGVVGHLYSKELEHGQKDTAIETWFANEVDSPFTALLGKLTDSKQIRQAPFRGDPSKKQTVKSLGYKLVKEIEYIQISESEREVISRYIAALLVRNPSYLKKLEEFHSSSVSPKNNALDNMQYVYKLYFEKIMFADFLIVRRDSDHEFLFSDGGIIATEPWSNEGGIPFDIHFPVTPDIALQVFPTLNQKFPEVIPIARATNKGVSGQNRITLQYAKKQVFGRSPIPKDFVMKNWGKPAPKHIKFRHVNGKLETGVDWSRHFH